MDEIRYFFLDKIKEKHIVDKLLKEYVEDNGQIEIDVLLKKYYLTEMNFLEYLAEAKIIKNKFKQKNQYFNNELKHR